MYARVLPALTAMALIAGCAAHSPPAVPKTASATIPFVTFGNINDWRAEGTKGLYIQSDDRKWYRATFMAPCNDLPYAEQIGFRTTPPLALDKFDSVVVHGQTCFFSSLEAVAGPPGGKPKAATG